MTNAATSTFIDPAESPLVEPSRAEATRVFARIGLLSFGGPAGQIALMHDELVVRHRWIDDQSFLHALNFCHLLPGPEAQQLATYIGWRLHGVRGGLTAGLLFVVPGALVMLALSLLYVLTAGIGAVGAIFLGVKAAVLGIVAQAVWRIGQRALDAPLKRLVAIGAFLALVLLHAPFPLIVVVALGLGGLVAATRPDWLAIKPLSVAKEVTPPSLARSLRTAMICGLAWAAPILALIALFGNGHILVTIALFFSKLAVVSFGGAYAVLAYMAQQAVDAMGWLSPGQMTDGLGLAETTPGPLIMVTQYVGFLAAYHSPGPFSPIVAGCLGALVTTWVTFAPCFLWVLTFAPWIEHLRGATRLRGGMAAMTAAVVGVIAQLGLWFALHVLFRAQTQLTAGPIRLDLPIPASLDAHALLLTLLGCVLLFGLRQSPLRTLGMCAGAGWLLGMLYGGSP